MKSFRLKITKISTKYELSPIKGHMRKILYKSYFCIVIYSLFEFPFEGTDEKDFIQEIILFYPDLFTF